MVPQHCDMQVNAAEFLGADGPTRVEADHAA